MRWAHMSTTTTTAAAAEMPEGGAVARKPKRSRAARAGAVNPRTARAIDDFLQCAREVFGAAEEKRGMLFLCMNPRLQDYVFETMQLLHPSGCSALVELVSRELCTRGWPSPVSSSLQLGDVVRTAVLPVVKVIHAASGKRQRCLEDPGDPTGPPTLEADQIVTERDRIFDLGLQVLFPEIPATAWDLHWEAVTTAPSSDARQLELTRRCLEYRRLYGVS